MSAKRVYYKDMVFVVNENVYYPSDDSILFAENLELEGGERVIDMGTGCGILGIIAAEKARVVIAVDLNPYALFCAKKNAAINNIHSKIVFVQGDLFRWLNEKAKFDVIMFNAPYLPSDKSDIDSWIELAWAGGTNGRQTIDRFISEVKMHLAEKGRVLLMQSNLANIDETMISLEENHLASKVIAERKLPFFENVALVEGRI